MNIWSWQIISGGGDIRNENILPVFPREIIWNFLIKKNCRNVINLKLPPLNWCSTFCLNRSVPCNSSTKSLRSHDGYTDVVLFMYWKAVSRWVSNSSMNVGCQWTVSSMYLRIILMLFSTDTCTQLLPAVIKYVCCFDNTLYVTICIIENW